MPKRARRTLAGNALAEDGEGEIGHRLELLKEAEAHARRARVREQHRLYPVVRVQPVQVCPRAVGRRVPKEKVLIGGLLAGEDMEQLVELGHGAFRLAPERG